MARKYVFKGRTGRQRRERVDWPLEIKGVITKISIDDDEASGSEVIEQGIELHNEMVEAGDFGPKAKPFNYTNNPEDERLTENGGDGSVKLLPASYRDGSKHASGVVWSIREERFLGVLNNPKHKLHKRAQEIKNILGIELEEVEVDEDGEVVTTPTETETFDEE